MPWRNGESPQSQGRATTASITLFRSPARSSALDVVNVQLKLWLPRLHLCRSAADILSAPGAALGSGRNRGVTYQQLVTSNQLGHLSRDVHEAG